MRFYQLFLLPLIIIDLNRRSRYSFSFIRYANRLFFTYRNVRKEIRTEYFSRHAAIRSKISPHPRGREAIRHARTARLCDSPKKISFSPFTPRVFMLWNVSIYLAMIHGPVPSLCHFSNKSFVHPFAARRNRYCLEASKNLQERNRRSLQLLNLHICHFKYSDFEYKVVFSLRIPRVSETFSPTSSFNSDRSQFVPMRISSHRLSFFAR